MAEPDDPPLWEPQPAAAAVVEAGHPPGHTACPRCHHSVPEGEEDAWWSCDACSWSGRVRWFSPLRDEARVGEAAAPEDAVCAHHPGRRAEEVCAGSGAYLCPLCAVKLHGRVFDTHYVEAGGRTDLEEVLQRTLPRPDRAASYSVLLALPFLFVCVGPVFWVIAIVYGVFHFRLRPQNALYREVSEHAWVILSLVSSVLGLVATAAAIVAGGLSGVLL